jgi:hypothetical protein
MASRLYSEDEHLAYDPLLVVQEWPHHARHVFAKFPPDVRASHCHLMFLSTHPQEHTGNPLWARSYVYVFRSPNFQAEMIPVHTLGSIGCGNSYEPCRAAVGIFSSDYKRRMLFEQGEVRAQGGMATILGFNLTQLLTRTQPGGISSHLHYCWVFRGQIIIKTNNQLQKGRWSILEQHGSGINLDQNAPDTSTHAALENGATAFEMPRLAATWEELNLLAIIRKRSFLDFGRTGVIDDTAKLEAQVLEIAAGSGMFQEFLNDGLEVGQGTDSRQWRHVSGPHRTAEAGQQESGLNHGPEGRRDQTRGEPGAGPERWRATACPAGPVEVSTAATYSAGLEFGSRIEAAGVISSSGARRFPARFRAPIAVAFNRGDVGVMEQTIQQRDDTGRVGKDFVPFFERTVGSQDDRLAFVTPVDDFVEQIGRLVVEGQIPDLVDAQKSNIGVPAQLAAAAFRRLPVQFFEQRRSGTKQHGVTGEHRGMAMF